MAWALAPSTSTKPVVVTPVMALSALAVVATAAVVVVATGVPAAAGTVELLPPQPDSPSPNSTQAPTPGRDFLGSDTRFTIVSLNFGCRASAGGARLPGLPKI